MKFVVLFLLTPLLVAAQMTLSERAEISVITCGPGQDELYSAFGHSAIRVLDPSSGFDVAYNYGVFHFDSKFYLNFTKGYLFYKLGAYPYPAFRDFYISENRFVHEQVLNLSFKQKQKVLSFLENNAKPENAKYRYDYFYNNCATKVRDLFSGLFPGSLKFDGSYINTNYSIRNLMDLYLKEQPWGDLGIDLCLGLPIDKKLMPYEYMFLPDYVESGFDHAKIDGVPIVKKKIVVFQNHPVIAPFNISHPFLVFGLFLLTTIITSYHDLKRKKLKKWFDVFLFSLVGWIGILLLFLWFATDHHAAARNCNLLWAIPLHAVAAIWLNREMYDDFLVKYFFATGILCLSTLFFWSFLPQQLNVFLIPVIFSLALRSFTIARILSRKQL